MAAKMPANLPTSKGAFAAAGSVPAASFDPAVASTALSLAAANLAIWSPIIRPTRL
jgi:hypothetical protein